MSVTGCALSVSTEWVHGAARGTVSRMSDRTPPPNRGPERGTPEYDWLYGNRRQSAPDDATEVLGSQPPNQPPFQPHGQQPPQRPDSTRVMPTMPRPEAGVTPPNQTPHRTPPPPPTPPSSGGGGFGMPGIPKPPRPHLIRRFFQLKLLLGLLIPLWLVYTLVTPFWAMSKVSKVDAWPDGDRPADQPGTTYLLVGSDSRAGLTKEEQKEYHAGGDVGQRTDTIMLLHTGDGPNLLMSIPRDSVVDIPGHGSTKINAAFSYGGPKLLVKTIEKNTGIRIDDYVEIGFGGFVKVVDAVGGVEICPTERMKDAKADLDIQKGCQDVDGVTALAYSRSRHTSALGDIDRAKHQREVVSAVGKKAISPWSVINPIRWWKLNFAAAESVQISDGTSVFSFGKFAWAMTHVNGDSGLTCGVPIADLAVHWDSKRSKEMFQDIIEDDSQSIADDKDRLCTPSGMPK